MNTVFITGVKNIVKLIAEVSTGGTFYYHQIPVQSSAESYDQEKARILWDGSESLAGIKFTY